MDVLSARQCQSRTLKMNHVEKNALAGLAKTKMPVIKIEKNWVWEMLQLWHPIYTHLNFRMIHKKGIFNF